MLRVQNPVRSVIAFSRDRLLRNEDVLLIPHFFTSNKKQTQGLVHTESKIEVENRNDPKSGADWFLAQGCFPS